MGKEELEELRAYLDSSDSSRDGRVGLKNVHQRLIHEYGPGYGIQISSESGRYTAVTIHIPRTAGKDEKDE